MDFDMHYTKEQEDFRKEVRAWLEANTRPDMPTPNDLNRLTREQYDYFRELRHKAGEKGWLAPLYPKEYGGGGLTREHAVILAEELSEERIPFIGDIGIIHAAAAIFVNGTEEQKKRFVPMILTAEGFTWQCFTEPDAGTDLASLRTRAERDGDDFIINGQKTFTGAAYDVDYLYTLAVTDPNKPRHNNLGAFMIPAKTPGVTIQPLPIIAEGLKNSVYFDNVRVSSSQLIGGVTDGWRVAQSTLEVEHGGNANPVYHDPFLDKVITYCRETKRNGVTLSKDPAIRDAIVELYMNSRIQFLFGLRNYWMRTARVPWAWEGSQSSLYRKITMPGVAAKVLSMIGPYALVTDPERQPFSGEFEIQQRGSILTHPGGTPEAQKIIMARRIGISRTRQKAAAIV